MMISPNAALVIFEIAAEWGKRPKLFEKPASILLEQLVGRRHGSAPRHRNGGSPMNLNGRTLVPLLLLGFWLFVAFRAFSHGDRTLALVYLGVGVALTTWRLKRASA